MTVGVRSAGSIVRQGWRLLGGLLILLVIYLSLTPDPVTVPVEQGDKYSHTLAYLTLMFWFASLCEKSTERVMLAAAFVLLGVCLEFVQRWTGVRSFEVFDMVAGASGVAAGWLLAPPRLPNVLRLAERFWPAG